MKLGMRCVAAALSFGLMADVFAGATLRGTVFLDSNANGARDKDEHGIEGVSVSDGHSVARSAADGAFSLESIDAKPTVFISTPSGYLIPPKGGWFANAVEADKKLEFPLVKDPAPQDDFSFIHITDTHLQSEKADKPNGDFIYKYVAGSQTWKYFFEKAMPQILKTEPKASFIVDTGDFGIKETASSPTADAKLFREKVEAFKIPYFFVPGNHDGPEALELCPPHYSFNKGKMHFVFLKRFPDVENTELTRQFEWLAKDLAFLPPNTPTIIFCHAVFGMEGYGKEKSIDRNPEFMKILEGCDAKAYIYGHIHQSAMEKFKNMLQFSTPSFNFGGGWSQDFRGIPPSYRVVNIKGSEIASTAVKSIEASDSPIWILCPKDMTVVEGAMYPYFNSCTFWDGRLRAMVLSERHADVAAMSYKIDDGDYKPLAFYAKVPGQQGEWSTKDDIKKAVGPGKHTLTLKADGKDGQPLYEKSITLLSDESFLPKEWPNLLPNISFEEKSADGTAPAGWKVDGKTVSWDDKDAKSGTHSLRIQMERPYERLYIIDDLPVESEGVYNLSFTAKGKNVLKMSYSIFPGMSDAHLVRFPDGTYDWTKINTQFRIKPGVTKIGLCIANHTSEKREEGSGVLWIDDISLRRVK